MHSDAGAAPLHFGRIVIMGGGCYGSWYAQQLTRAARRGALQVGDVVVVDRDPACRVAGLLAAGTYDDRWIDEALRARGILPR